MASALCEDCSRLLRDAIAHFKNFCTEFERKIRVFFRDLSQCTCFRITPEKYILRRTTQDLTSVHLLSGGSIVSVDFLCCSQHFCGQRAHSQAVGYSCQTLRLVDVHLYVEDRITVILCISTKANLVVIFHVSLPDNNLCAWNLPDASAT